MTGELTLGALSRISLAHGKKIATVAAPIGSEIRKWRESVRNAMVELDLIRITIGIGFADTLGDHARIAVGVTCVLAVFALHARAVFEKLTAVCATHDVEELLGNESVTISFLNILLLLTNGAFPPQSEIEICLAFILLDEAEA